MKAIELMPIVGAAACQSGGSRPPYMVALSSALSDIVIDPF
jgi:hypothetical protein